MIALFLALQLAVWQPVVSPVLHQGSWQSCDHEERVLEHYERGRVRWVLHLGPDDEFALYDAAHDVEGPDHTHDGPDNRLAPAYHVTADATWRGKRQWTVPDLHLWVSIVVAGGSHDECMSFYVKVRHQ